MELTLSESTALDLAVFLGSAGLVAVYHLYLRVRLSRDPSYTVQAVNREARRRWVAHIMESGSNSVLGVQTLRNSTMAATFLASTSVILIMGTLNLASDADKLAVTWDALHLGGSPGSTWWLFKLLVLVVDLFVAFFSFTLAIRLFNHVGYQITVPVDGDHPEALRPEAVAAHLNRAGQYHSTGMRAYYFTVPLVFWLFGPFFLLGASVILIAVLYRVDRMPKVGSESGPR